MERLISILQKLSVEHYKINCETRKSSELFFVRNNLDLSRANDTTETVLTVYSDYEKDGRKMRGSSKVFIYPDTSDDKIEELVSKAKKQAQYVENPFFELPGKENCAKKSDKEYNLMDEAVKMAEALFSVDMDERTFINSAEIFAISKTVRVVNSEGVDVTYTKFGVEGEFVVQSIENDNDVELFKQFAYDIPDSEALKKKCSSALKDVRDRAYAEHCDDLLPDYPVILCDNEVNQLLRFYFQRTDASYIHPGYSDYRKGNMVSEDIEGEKISLSLKADRAVDGDGVVLKDTDIIKDGKIVGIHGNIQYTQYLSEKNVGMLETMVCSNGTLSIEEMKKSPYIMIKSFSDFQMDSMDGYFGGEFRLAYIFDGEKERIVTGGTYSGNMFDAQKKLNFSTERYIDAEYEGPAAVRIGVGATKSGGKE